MANMDPQTTLLLAIVGLLAGIFGIWALGGLPGSIARKRKHPNAEAISICGWIGVLIWPAWIVAIIWAHTTPKR